MRTAFWENKRNVLNDTVAFHTFTIKLARTSDGCGCFTGFLFRRLFKETTHLHLTIDAFTLQFFLQRAKSLVYVIVADRNLHWSVTLLSR